MIVTTAAFGAHQLTLIASVNEHSRPKLVEVNWLIAGDVLGIAQNPFPNLRNTMGLSIRALRLSMRIA